MWCCYVLSLPLLLYGDDNVRRCFCSLDVAVGVVLLIFVGDCC